MSFWYRPYTTPTERIQAVWKTDGELAADIVGDVRNTESDMPVCYVHSHVSGAKIANALNAQALHTQRNPHGRANPKSHT